MAQQPERDFLPDRRLLAPGGEHRHPFLHILLSRRDDEFEHGAALALRRRQPQAAPAIRGLALFFRPQKGQKGLLGGGVEPIRHGAVPAMARREPVQEFPDLRQRRDGEPGLHADGPGAGKTHDQGHQNRRETAGGNPVGEDAAGEIGHEFRKDRAVLEADPEPEGNADDHALAKVHAVLHRHPDADHEQQGEQDQEIGADDWARDGQHDRQRLGQEGQGDEYRSGGDRHGPRRDSGDLDDRCGVRIGRVRDGPGQAAQQVAHAVDRDRALYRPEIDRPLPAPRDPLERRAAAHRPDRPDHGGQQEGRKQRPEIRPEIQVEAGNRDIR